MGYDHHRMEKRPPRTALVLAICAALGATGLTLGLAGVLSWDEPVPEMQTFRLPDAPEGEEAAWERVEEAWNRLPSLQVEVLRRRRPALGALAAANVLASGALLWGALAARMRRRNGLSSLRTGLVLSQAWAVLATGVHVWVQLEVLSLQRPALQPLIEEGGSVAGMAQLALAAQLAAVGITAALTLGQLAFYIWAHVWSGRPAVREALAPIDPPA